MTYISNTSDKQWEILKVYFARESLVGHPQEYELRRIVDACLYVLKTGCQWRMLPSDFPPWPTVYFHFRCWRDDGTWQIALRELHKLVRLLEGRDDEPTAGIIDSQTVKSKRGGYDAGKKIKGSKRHILVDVLGFPMKTIVHGAEIQDRDGARSVIAGIKKRFPRLRKIWADGGYAGKLEEWCKVREKICLEIVRKTKEKGFKVLPKRWVVERTFGWLLPARRLTKDYELSDKTEESWLAMRIVTLLTNRLL